MCIVHLDIMLLLKYAYMLVAQSCLTPWTVGYESPLSMEFSRQEYWCGLLFPIPGDIPDSRARTHDSCVSRIDRWILYHSTTWETL